MVGFERESAVQKFHKLDYIIAGAVSGFVTRTLFQPLDVIKIRFQLQIEPIGSHCKRSKYKGMLHAFHCILKEEGAQALWKGIVPAQLLSTSYGALQFFAFEVLTQQASDHLPNRILTDVKPIVNFTCGALAGCIATTGSLPFDVMRTRLVAQGEPKTYKNMFHAATVMIRTEGLLSFYKGLSPTLIQIMPNAGAQFAFYKFFQGLWDFVFQKGSSQTTAVQSSCCGAASGIAAKVLVYPLDLIKKRFQVQGFEEARKAFGAVRRYTGVLHCASCILREEGFIGLYKGLWPSVLKAACTTGSHFLYYEETLKILALFHRSVL
ncbi:mitochondrial thiamine pyrophosphate carrier-like isoform X1 [Stegodyphus dumicola]|uniref:mitochondrial thiamine pyrophosphate carrier-like isoform X1 n=1 Tax=Stegodyphus dumicola TaxID=202533 RepID=UPI0015AD3F98|nr:mitochondrial thiamine pyrophosphate carrier-like isoform X1 [Stegodyphus dumicola]XP_035223672.1 mitochondrial thiamine pyrophosphate carrier-like isoform X1 [Stegodyphus dumicola]XP_035223673.1 mitochondrial thiamine pyrophosphate carrier-like isoform X1 [Stegodyphus dumicola]